MLATGQKPLRAADAAAGNPRNVRLLRTPKERIPALSFALGLFGALIAKAEQLPAIKEICEIRHRVARLEPRGGGCQTGNGLQSVGTPVGTCHTLSLKLPIAVNQLDGSLKVELRQVILNGNKTGPA